MNFQDRAKTQLLTSSDNKNLSVGNKIELFDVEDAYNSAIKTTDGTPCAIWRQRDAHKMARSSTLGKKGLPCDLETGSPLPNN